MPKAIKRRPNFKSMGNEIEDTTVRKLRLLGSEIIVGIIKRTQKGKDVNNRKFKKYSKAYGKIKSKKYGGTTPNLTATGNMLNAINQKDIKNGIRIYFIGNEEKRKAKQNQKKRKFFGVDRKQKAKIKKRLKG